MELPKLHPANNCMRSNLKKKEVRNIIPLRPESNETISPAVIPPLHRHNQVFLWGMREMANHHRFNVGSSTDIHIVDNAMKKTLSQ
jgi:hypothetical protein